MTRTAWSKLQRAATAAAATATLALTVGAAGTAEAANTPGVTVGGLRIDNRADQPLGVDDPAPTLSWRLSGSGAAARQTAYEVSAGRTRVGRAKAVGGKAARRHPATA